LLCLGITAGLCASGVSGCASNTLLGPPPTTSTIPITRVIPAYAPLAGLIGTSPAGTPTDAFVQRLQRLAPTITEVIGAAQAYDAIIVSALAATLQRSDAPGAIAQSIMSVTNGTTKCLDWTECNRLAVKNPKVDYSGQSGPINMLSTRVPGEGSFQVSRIEPDGALTGIAVRSARSDPPTDAPAPADPSFGPPADGAFRIGLLLPITIDQPDAVAQRAGAQLAVEDLNHGGGVLGSDAVLVEQEAGATPDTALASVAALLAQHPDIVLGMTRHLTTTAVISAITDSGVIAWNTAGTAEPITGAQHGLFFSAAAPEDLQGRVIADVVTGDGFLHPTLVVGQDPQSQLFSVDLARRLGALGGTVAQVIPVATTPEGISQAVAAISGVSAECLVFLLPTDRNAALFAALLAAKRSPTTPQWYVPHLSPAIAPTG
jgi:ABC-type branched-subunit amino acid transport system substrate-binding protein